MGDDAEWRACVDERMEAFDGLHGDVQDLVERLGAVVNLVKSNEAMNAAYANWRRNPEDIAKGVAFAHAAAELLTVMPRAIPDLPGASLLEPVLDRLVRVVDALGGLLRDRITQIDEAATRLAGDVRLWDDHGPTCSAGRIGSEGARIIRSLPVGASEKASLFRSACHNGLIEALEPYLTHLTLP